MPAIPTSIDSITVLQHMSFTDVNEQFLFYNSTTPHKVVEFASETADGTFSTSPSLFSQAYYIHVWDEYSMKPMIYLCCQDKSQQIY